MVLRIKGAMVKLHNAYIGIGQAMQSPDLTTYQIDRLEKAQDIINDVMSRLEDQSGLIYDPPRRRVKGMKRGSSWRRY